MGYPLGHSRVSPPPFKLNPWAPQRTLACLRAWTSNQHLGDYAKKQHSSKLLKSPCLVSQTSINGQEVWQKWESVITSTWVCLRAPQTYQHPPSLICPKSRDHVISCTVGCMPEDFNMEDRARYSVCGMLMKVTGCWLKANWNDTNLPRLPSCQYKVHGSLNEVP